VAYPDKCQFVTDATELFARLIHKLLIRQKVEIFLYLRPRGCGMVRDDKKFWRDYTGLEPRFHAMMLSFKERFPFFLPE
jgi:hypothetical protein